MRNSFIIATFVALLPFNLMASEPSAFGAGDLSNPEPYGLTSSEEILLENKNKLHKVVVKSNNQDNQVDSLREQINGLQSIIETLSFKSQENKLKIKKIINYNTEVSKSTNEFQNRISEVIQANANLIKSNSENIDKIKLVMSELSSLIDLINSKYVSKAEFNTLVNDVNVFKELVTQELKAKNGNPTSKISPLDSMTPSSIVKKAKELYNKRDYAKSIEYYTYLIGKNYKPASAHYMIGEIKYFTGNYEEAIAYFKKSAALYSKASYMPYLMLHTAVSMQKIGDNSNAKLFYNGIISKYPKSKSAVEAKKYIASMK